MQELLLHQLEPPKSSSEVLQYHEKLDCQSLQAVSYAWSCLPMACLTCRVCLKNALHCLHHMQNINTLLHESPAAHFML